jgi:lysophospholipase L1-like esterase
MKTILCYGDSNTWGRNPIDSSRYGKDERWPGVLQQELGKDFDVISEGLPGRTTVWTDPIEGHMSGKDYLIPCLHSHMPVDLVIILLGTNDLKHRFGVTAFDIAEGIGHLVKMIQQSESGPGGRSPQVLILIPPPLGKLSKFSEMFTGGVEKSKNLSQQYKRVAELLAFPHLDTSEHIVSSDVDGVHFDASTHQKLGQVVAQQVKAVLRKKNL